MIYVTASHENGLEWLAFRRLEARYGARRARQYYLHPAYPGLLIQTQGADFGDALFETLADSGPLVALWSGPEENEPERWRNLLGELADKPDIRAKVSFFRPREASVPETMPLEAYLKERYGELSQNLKTLRARAAKHAGLGG